MTVLNELARRVAARLELVSTVQSSTLDGAAISHAKASSREPRGTPAPHVVFRRRYDSCRTDDQRRHVIRDGLEELRALKYSPDRSMVRGTREWRTRIAADPRPARITAYVFNVALSSVYLYRKQAGQSGRVGVSAP